MSRVDKPAGKQKKLAGLPQVSKMLSEPLLSPYLSEFSHDYVVFCIQREIDACRKQLLGNDGEKSTGDLAKRLARKIVARLGRSKAPSLKRVINATGIILHTGLGRAPFSETARENLENIAAGYCNVEVDLDSGKRGDRGAHVEEMLRFLTGAEAACVVNNNAAAVLLALNTLAFQKETIVSRGQLVEIGGSFRIPEIMEKSGTRMVEVGTTNKTHLRDYEQAIADSTGLICAVHTSNYRIQGFTHEVDVTELARLAHLKDLPLMQDLGGGILTDLRTFGLPHEPVAKSSLAAGVDVVTFSGDKVLGGPQCGIIAGKKKYLDLIRANPFMRALRCDKMVYAVLEPTLKGFLNPDRLADDNEVFHLLLQTREELFGRAERLAGLCGNLGVGGLVVSVEKTSARMGSGAMPLEKIPSAAISLHVENVSVERLARRLREAPPPVVGYVRNERLFLDLRAVSKKEDELLGTILSEILTSI